MVDNNIIVIANNITIASQICVLATLLSPCLAIPAKLNHLARSPIDNQLTSYNYEAPDVPSGLYELPGPVSVCVTVSVSLTMCV